VNEATATEEILVETEVVTEEDVYITPETSEPAEQVSETPSETIARRGLETITQSRRERRQKSQTTAKASSEDLVALYLYEIGGKHLLTADQEKELAKRIEKGRIAGAKLEKCKHLNTPSTITLATEVQDGVEAKDDFIRANLRLVVSIAKKYPLPRGMSLLDLIQEGNLGLEHAVIKFDWRKGFKFSTYADHWIKQAIGRALDSKTPLKVPGRQGTRMRAFLRANGGEEDQLSAEDYEVFQAFNPGSLNNLVGDGQVEFGELLASSEPDPAAVALQKVQNDEVRAVLDLLDPIDRKVIEMRFGLMDGVEKSFPAIANELGVTNDKARRMVNNTMEVLRKESYRLREAS